VCTAHARVCATSTRDCVHHPRLSVRNNHERLCALPTLECAQHTRETVRNIHALCFVCSHVGPPHLVLCRLQLRHFLGESCKRSLRWFPLHDKRQQATSTADIIHRPTCERSLAKVFVHLFQHPCVRGIRTRQQNMSSGYPVCGMIVRTFLEVLASQRKQSTFDLAQGQGKHNHGKQ
jgi:hypothetical protein